MKELSRRSFKFCYEVQLLIENRDIKKYPTEKEFVEGAIMHYGQLKHNQYVELRFLELEQKVKQLEEKINYENPNQDFSAINTFN